MWLKPSFRLIIAVVTLAAWSAVALASNASSDAFAQFSTLITQPTIAYLLLVIGIYGIFFELISPGFGLPGIIGGLALLLSLYAFQSLPVNYFGFALIIIGIAAIFAELAVQSFNVLGFGGTLVFIWGSLVLMDGNQSLYQVAWQAIAAMVFTNFVFLIVVGRLFLRSRKQKALHGVAMLVGAEGRTLGPVDHQGQAVIRGEIWAVHSKQPIGENREIKVVSVKGLILEVKELTH